MIATHEEAVIAFTTDREELIKESRQNELYGEQIIQIIKTKCPSILGKNLKALPHLHSLSMLNKIYKRSPTSTWPDFAIRISVYSV